MTHTVAQVADRYSVGQHTVLSWIKAGDLKAVNVGRTLGGSKPRWRITEAAIEAFESLRSAPTAPLSPKKRQRRKSRNVVEFYKL